MAEVDWSIAFETAAESLFPPWRLEFDDGIVPNNPRKGWKKYIRNTSASFQCSICPRKWPSNKVMVIFHMNLYKEEGVVKVRRTRQNCKKCTEAPMEAPNVEPDNVEILMENLVKKIREKCYNENQGKGEQPPRKLMSRSPHEPDHCEGCKLGICSLTNNFEGLSLM